jgi:RNA polymerase sigma factor (sigma-70 family)
MRYDDEPLEELARTAGQGNKDALEAVCSQTQHMVYRLALRFLGFPQDAEDATQEIMIKVITHVGAFEGRSKFTTWVYTIASRHLLETKKRFVESSVKGPVPFGQWLDTHLADHDYDAASRVEYDELCGEVRISCTYGMLLCISRDARIAYLLGDLIGLTDVEGAEILGIGRAAFRQRVARARATLRTVIANRCGLVTASNPCRCSRQITSSIEAGILDVRAPLFARHPRIAEGSIPAGTLERAARQLDMAEAIAELYRSDPSFLAPKGVWDALRKAAPDLIG